MIFDVAIVGGGAAAVSYFDALSRLLILNKKRASVIIFDKEANFGIGEVYTDDYPWLIMNTPAQDLSACYGVADDFIQWTSKKGDAINQNGYVPRQLFGQYLKEKLFTLLERNSDSYSVELITSKVTNIERCRDAFSLVTARNGKYKARFVIIASRHMSANDPYKLSGESNYILNPYPMIKKIRPVIKNKKYLIIGSGLTAVDCAITLYKEKSPAHLVMVSTRGDLPQVKGRKLFAYQPSFFLAERIIDSKQVSLRRLLRFARKEFRYHAIDWREFLFKQGSLESRITYFNQQIDVAKAHPTHFNVVLGMIPELARVWPYMEDASIDLFMCKYFPAVQHKHGAIPLVNAEKILSMIANEELLIQKGIKAIKKSGSCFVVRFDDDSMDSFDYVFNATGPGRRIECNDKNQLYVNLMRNGMIEQRSSGGIKVSYPDSHPIVKNEIVSKGLYLVGHNAEGTHLFTNNFQWIVEIAFLAASNLIQKL